MLPWVAVPTDAAVLSGKACKACSDTGSESKVLFVIESLSVFHANLFSPRPAGVVL